MRHTLITVVALTLFAGSALAQDRAKIGELATKLGVSKWNLIGCARGAGGRPARDASEQQRRAFAMALYDCLSAKNPKLTREQFRSTMLEMRQ